LTPAAVAESATVCPAVSFSMALRWGGVSDKASASVAETAAKGASTSNAGPAARSPPLSPDGAARDATTTSAPPSSPPGAAGLKDATTGKASKANEWAADSDDRAFFMMRTLTHTVLNVKLKKHHATQINYTL
jgi:hypothetical protein